MTTTMNEKYDWGFYDRPAKVMAVAAEVHEYLKAPADPVMAAINEAYANEAPVS